MPAKFLRALYRLVMPGGLILLLSALAVHAEFLKNSPSFWRDYPYIIFGAGLVLSAMFNRSRLFFAILIVAISDRALLWLAPRLASAGIHRTLFDAIALLLPLNLLALSFLRDRGIVSPRGRRRVAWIAAQIAVVAGLIFVEPARVLAATLVNDALVPRRYSEWSHMSQPALMVFVLAGVLMLIYLLHRRRPVENGLFWALCAGR